MKVALATFNSPSYQELAELTLPGKKAYCQRHGYDLIAGVHHGSIERMGWDRIGLVDQWLPKYDAVMWVDCDAIITNHTKKVTDVVSPTDNFVLTADLYGLNTGTFVAVNNLMTRQFLFAVLAAGPELVEKHHWGEQEAIIRLLQSPPWNNFARVVPQNAMNSYLNSAMGRPDWFMGNFQPGDWILHMAGIPYPQKLEIARVYTANAIV